MPRFLSYLGWREAISLPTTTKKKKHNTLNHRFNTQKLAEVMQKLAVELGLGLRNSWPVARVQSTGFHCGLPLVLMETPVPAVSTWHLLFCVL